MGFFDKVKGWLGIDIKEEIINEENSQEELLQGDHEEIVELDPVLPSINYAIATKEAKEVIDKWMQYNGITTESFGQILHKLGSVANCSYNFTKLDVPISSPYRNREENFIGAVECLITTKKGHCLDMQPVWQIYILYLYKDLIITSIDTFSSTSYPLWIKDNIWSNEMVIPEVLEQKTNEFVVSIDDDGKVCVKRNVYLENTKRVRYLSDKTVPSSRRKLRSLNWKRLSTENKTTMLANYNDNSVLIEFETTSSCLDKFNKIHEQIHEWLCYNIALDIVDNIPIIDWCNNRKFGEDCFYRYFLSYSPYFAELRKNIGYKEENDINYNRDKEIKRFTERYSMVDILSQVFVLEISAYNKDNFDYKYIKISTAKSEEKCLELTYQLDENIERRRIFISNKDGEIIRNCIVKNEYLDNNMMRRVVEITQGEYSITLEVNGQNIEVLVGETKLLLRLFEFFPIKANIDWVWNGISKISFMNPPINYASVKLNFYKNGKLIDKRVWNNSSFGLDTTSHVTKIKTLQEKNYP